MDAHARFPDHFSTKSRRYSTTLRCLRQARQDWRNKRLVDGIGYREGTHVDRHDDHRQGDDKDVRTRSSSLASRNIGAGATGQENASTPVPSPTISEFPRIARQTVNEEER